VKTERHNYVISAVFVFASHVYALCDVGAGCEDTVPDWTCTHYQVKDYCAASYEFASYITGVCPVTCG